MDLDFSDIFDRYRELAAQVDRVFATVRERHPAEVTCAQGCADCCHALFDLTLVEAVYLNQAFEKQFEGLHRDRIQQRADVAERNQIKLVRKAVKGRENIQDDADEIITGLSSQRIRCPLLDDDNRCELYEDRPLTCRLYGIPQAIAGQARTCGLSGFLEGKPYPTVDVSKIQDRLIELSQEMVARLTTTLSGLVSVHVPVSTALLNDYNEDYFGQKKKGADALPDDEDENPEETA